MSPIIISQPQVSRPVARLHVASPAVEISKPAVADAITDVWSHVNVLEIFPVFFTFWCALMFVGAIVKSGVLAGDPSVNFWIGDLGPRIIVALPIVFCCLGHILHRRRRAPCKTAIIVSIIGPSIVLWCFSDAALQNAHYLSNSFAASDCQSYTEKYKLEVEWLAAKDFRDRCSGNVTSGPRPLTECPGYASELAKHPDWAYLQQIESEYGCTGWCESATALWSTSPPKDSCSTVVSEILRTKVRYISTQVACYTMMTATTTAIVIVLMGPSMNMA